MLAMVQLSSNLTIVLTATWFASAGLFVASQRFRQRELRHRANAEDWLDFVRSDAQRRTAGLQVAVSAGRSDIRALHPSMGSDAHS